MMRAALGLILTIGIALGMYAQTGQSLHSGPSVSVPALIEDRSGKIVYGLSASNFSIKDDGVPQRVDLDTDSDARPLSLIIVIQTGHNAAPQFSKIARLNDLLDGIITNPNDQVAIVSFDGSPHVIQGFTTNSDAISSALVSISAGNSRAALFDALHTAMQLFAKAPSGNRRILLLISGEHDHGSNAFGTAYLIQAISSSDASVYSLSFSATKNGPLGHFWSFNPLAMTATAMQRNAPEALSQLTGGEYYRFKSEKNFEDRVSEIANHIHNQYLLAFRPNDPQPGFHSLQVDLLGAKANVVTARTGYWLSAAGSASDVGSSQ